MPTIEEIKAALALAEEALAIGQENVTGTDDLSEEGAEESAYYDALKAVRELLAKLA